MTIIIKIGIIVLNFIYSIFKLLPQRKKISVMSRQSDSPSMDILLLKDTISRMHPDYSVVVLCRKLENSPAGAIKYSFHILRQMYHFATSKAVILDSYCISASILHHRKGLLIIQMWHSIGTMKKFGYSILDKPEGSSSKTARLMKMHANYDFILAAGDGYKSHLAEGFSYPQSRIVTLPLPRVQLLKSEEYARKIRDRIFAEYPMMKDKKNIVYVPTFRKIDDDGLTKALEALCDCVDYEKYNLIIKVHPLTDLNGFYDNRVIKDTLFSSFDMLFAADAVISDYSCIIYEAAVLRKPIYLYAYDYDEYMADRDIYMDYPAEMPGPICADACSLIAAIKDGSYDYDRLETFLNKYVFMGSDHETEDIVDFIFDHIKV